MALNRTGSAPRSRPVLALFFLAALALFFPRPSSAAFADDFERTLPMPAETGFSLQNINGTVTVQGWNREEIQIQAHKSSRGNPADAERVSIDVESTPRGVSVITHYPQDEGVEVVVDYTVRLPHSAHIQRIATINGSLRIAGVNTLSDLHTVNGNIEVYGPAATVHALTTNGNVSLELPGFAAAGEAIAETTNGSILLAVPGHLQATLEAVSLNGEFLSEIPLKLNSSRTPREIRGQYGKGGSPIRLRTVNGNIRVAALRPIV